MSKRPIPEMIAGDSSSDDDDDAPEEVSATASRQHGISQIKDMQESLRRNKNEERERRRQRHEMFRIQKKHKLADLSKRKLPEDVLVAMSAKPSTTGHDGDQETSNSAKMKRLDGDDEEEDSDENSDYKELNDSGVEDVDDQAPGFDEFIPLSTNNRLVLVTPQALAKKAETSAQKALEFKQNRLYNRATVPRQSAKQRRAQAAKRRALR